MPSGPLPAILASVKRFNRQAGYEWSAGIGLWLFLGFSLGWYYTFTYFGGRGWPLPYPEALAGVILYYFSLVYVDLNADNIWQALAWMAVFPLCGIIWTVLLRGTARLYEGRRSVLSLTVQRFGLAALPLALPGLWLAYAAGAGPRGFSVDRMVQVALRRDFVTPPGWLNYVFVACAVAALALQLAAYRKSFDVPLHHAWKHYLLSFVALVLFTAGLGTLVSFILRASSGELL